MTKFISHPGKAWMARSVAAAMCFALPGLAIAQQTPVQPANPIPRSTSARTGVVNPNVDFQKQYELMKLDMKDPIQAQYAGAVVMAKCVIRRAKDEAPSYVGGPFTDDPQYTALSTLLTKKFTNCLDIGSEKGVPMFVVNAALAEQLLLKEKPTLTDKPASLDMDAANAYYLTDGKIASLDALARCVAVNSPGLVAKLLETQANSPEEKAALEATFAGTPECGVKSPPQIATVEHREMLATGLYQWIKRN